MKLSVALAYYDGGKYIEEQVASILAQLGREDELIISVDQCEDGSRDLLKQMKTDDLYGRIRVIRGKKAGIVKNFEYAIRHCSGDIIFLADQDDIWLPGKVEAVVEAFADEEVMAVLHDACLIDKDGNALGEETMFSLRRSRTGKLKNFIRNSYVGCCMAFRRDLVPVILPIPRTMYMHDYWIGTAAEQMGRVVLIDKPYTAYRRHEGNVTLLEHGSPAFMLRKRLGILHCLHLLKIRIRKKGKVRP